MNRVVPVVVLLVGAFTPSALAAPIAVHTAFDATTVEFGDVVATHVVVLLDPGTVRPGSLRITEDLAPLSPLSGQRTTRTRLGHTLVIAVDRSASCISAACVSPRGDATPALRSVTVTATTRDGRPVRATVGWPVLRVRGRVSAADLARRQPPFRADTVAPPPAYRIAPSTLAWLLDALAVVLAVGAIALVAHQTTRLYRRRSRAATVDELGRALRMTREAEGRPPADRRRALGLLARLLAARSGRLAAGASDLAWAKPSPEPEAVAALVGEIEREVGT